MYRKHLLRLLEENNGTQAGGSSQAGGTSSTSTQAVTTTPSTPQAGGGKTSEDYERMIAELRRENATHRTKLKTFEEADEAAKLAAMGDLDKERKLREQTEAKLKEQQAKLIDTQVRLAAQSKGVHPDALDLVALALNSKLDASDADFEAKLDAALDDLLAAKPLLKVTESGTRYAPPTGANNPGRANVAQPGTLPPNTVIRPGDYYSQYHKKP